MSELNEIRFLIVETVRNGSKDSPIIQSVLLQVMKFSIF